ncbi:MAG: enoyl-CoA hydratase/isomerase family protein, partial [Proteobacteria bacterium]|nr:enoyl-CoA hydratase/isomerase family protein [Pseudomonadota bacterium]
MMKHIGVQIDGGLGTITLRKPPVNVFNIEMMDEINATLRDWIEEK